MNMHITQHNTTHNVIKHLVQNLDRIKDSNAKYHLIYTDHEKIKLLPLNLELVPWDPPTNPFFHLEVTKEIIKCNP